MSPEERMTAIERRLEKVEQATPAAAPAVSRVWLVTADGDDGPIRAVFVDRGRGEEFAEGLGVPALVESMEVQR